MIAVDSETAKVQLLGLHLTTSLKAKVCLRSTKSHTLNTTVLKAPAIYQDLLFQKSRSQDSSDLEKTTTLTFLTLSPLLDRLPFLWPQAHGTHTMAASSMAATSLTQTSTTLSFWLATARTMARSTGWFAIHGQPPGEKQVISKSSETQTTRATAELILTLKMVLDAQVAQRLLLLVAHAVSYTTLPTQSSQLLAFRTPSSCTE